MSAAAGTAPISGANNTSTDGSHLEQPNDAVPMTSIAQSPETSLPADSDDIKPSTQAVSGAPGINTGDAPAKTEGTDDDVNPLATDKGKGKEIVPHPPMDRQDSMAIGPAQDEIKAVNTGPSDGPVCNITLLLTTGSRHPYKIDGRYLSKRGVAVPEQTETGKPDPLSISIYTLKELILREWRSDWEAKPSSPSSIRLIHFGKLLDDKEPLKTYNFTTDNPNVVHMSIRPQDLEEDEPKTGGKNAQGGGGEAQRERSGGCCVVL